MKNLVKNNDMAKILGMTPSAFAKGVRTGRFTVAELNEKKEKLFDSKKVIRQYEATKNIAETQNHAAETNLLIIEIRKRCGISEQTEQ